MLKAFSSVAVVVIALSSGVAGFQQSPPALPQTAARGNVPALPAVGRIVKLDGALDAIVAENATVDKIATDIKFAEGPLWTRDGQLLFSDGPANTIYKMSIDGARAVFRTPSGYDGTDLPETFFKGSNGLTMDVQGRLIICEHGNRRLTRLEPNGTLTVLADKFSGRRLNSPDDAVVKRDGSIYFADPPYGLQGQDTDPKKEISFTGVYRWKDGAVDLLAQDLPRANGLGFSPDERFLYVSNSQAQRKVWMRYPVKADGLLDKGTVFLDVTTERAQGVPDGLKLDVTGNLYGTGPGGIWIISPDAKPLGRIELPEVPANMAWGGSDGRTLYITARTSIYKVQMRARGPRPCCDR